MPVMKLWALEDAKSNFRVAPCHERQIKLHNSRHLNAKPKFNIKSSLRCQSDFNGISRNQTCFGQFLPPSPMRSSAHHPVHHGTTNLNPQNQRASEPPPTTQRRRSCDVFHYGCQGNFVTATSDPSKKCMNFSSLQDKTISCKALLLNRVRDQNWP